MAGLDEELISNKKNEYLKELEHYVRTSPADMAAISNMAWSIKGDMSLNQFSLYCGVNKSSLSRLLNKKTPKYSQNDVIAVLAALADNIPDCHVTFDDLVKANGMTYSETPIKRYHKAKPRDICIDTILSTLLKTGSSVEIVRENFSGIYGPYFALLLKTNSVTGLWSFDICPFISNSQNIDNLKVQEIAFDTLQRLFSKLYLINGDSKYGKFSIIFNLKNIYSAAVTTASKMSIHDNLSLILMSNDCTRVIEETVVAPKDNIASPIFKKASE